MKCDFASLTFISDYFFLLFCMLKHLHNKICYGAEGKGGL